MTRVAAIDCGTNSIRLLITDLGDTASGQPPAEVKRRMEIVRLGAGVDKTGELAPEAIERTRVVLADYARQIVELGAERVRMVATSATRDARNRADFEAMVTDLLGQPAEVITGAEEAALSFLGATASLPLLAEAPPPPYLVVDIGGGSTEFVLGSGGAVTASLSVDIGCVRLTERHLFTDPPTPDEIGAAESDIRVALRAVAESVPIQQPITLIGLAGSVTTVAAVALGLPAYDPNAIHHSQIPVGDVRSTTAGLLTMTRAQRAALPVMHPGRVDVIGAGALILRVVMDAWEIDSLVVSEHDILDGIAASLADPRGPRQTG